MDNETRDLARRVADRLLSNDWKVWFWGDSSGLEGLLDAAELLQDAKYQSFVYGMVKAWVAKGSPKNEWEHTAAGVALLRVYEATGDDALLQKAVSHAEYLASFSQTENGAYIRYEDADLDKAPEMSAEQLREAEAIGATFNHKKGGPCVFVDTMHFDAPFFAYLFKITGDSQYRQLAADTIRSQIELLFQEETSLFHHFWVKETQQTNGVCWGRGQGWALLGMALTMKYLPDDDPIQADVLKVFRRQCEALASTQDSSGHWHTVILDEDSYLETSVAAFVADGFGRGLRHGWLDSSYQAIIDKALAALKKDVGPDGTVLGVSYETYPSLNLKQYRFMPRDAMVPWGQGPFLSAFYANTSTN